MLDETAWLEGIIGGSVTYLNKYNYQTTTQSAGFANDGAVGGGYFNPGGPLSQQITNISWNLAGSGYGVTYVLVKDGVVDPAGPALRALLYRLYFVSADESVVGGGTVSFPPDYSRNTSHITWFGTATTNVPDGGMTLTLLGFALVALGGLHRKFGA